LPRYSQEDLNNINELISGGVTKAKIAGEEVEYRSLPDLLKIKSLIVADLDSGRARSPLSVRYSTFDRGL
jgi:hypothetical protein